MIRALFGDNSYEVAQTLQRLTADYAGSVERIDGSQLQLSDIPDLFMGVSLFSPERLVVISQLSDNSVVWPVLPEWIERAGDHIDIILVDTKPDKRTTTYQFLQKNAIVEDYPAWTDRNFSNAEQWLSDYARKEAVAIDKKCIQYLVRKVGVDQWRLASAVDILRHVDAITPEVIDRHIEAQPSENVFELLEKAFTGDIQRLSQTISTLALTEDPYRLFGLLASQVTQLAAVAVAEPSDTPTKDFGIHPYVAGKLSRHAKNMGLSKVRRIVQMVAKTDADMKRSKAEPWVLIEQCLLTIALQK